jgi:hypothetical protein
MKLGELPTYSSNALDRLDAIRMHPGGRRIAKTCLRKSELLALMFMRLDRLDTQLHRVLAYAGRAFGAVARCKVRAETLEPN